MKSTYMNSLSIHSILQQVSSGYFRLIFVTRRIIPFLSTDIFFIRLIPFYSTHRISCVCVCVYLFYRATTRKICDDESLKRRKKKKYVTRDREDGLKSRITKLRKRQQFQQVTFPFPFEWISPTIGFLFIRSNDNFDPDSAVQSAISSTG